MTPKYQWLPTGLGGSDDYCGWDDGICFGRIYKYHLGYWCWFLNGINLGSASGISDEPREAAGMVEQAYDGAKAILVESGRFDKLTRTPLGSV